MSRRRKLLTIMSIVVIETLIIGLPPYFLSQGRVSVPFPSLRSEYGYTMSVQGVSVSGSLVLTTGDIVNASYIEVTEALQAATASTSASFYVNLVNRSIIMSQELTPELPTHGEYYDLWIGEGHAAGDMLNILNQTVTLSSSGLRFYGWTFFNTLTASNLGFNASQQFTYQGRTIPADYQGKITITYDQETGLMVEDQQAWTVTYVDSGMTQIISYSATITYARSNVRFTYFTYAMTTGIYATMTTALAGLAYAIVYVWRKRRIPKLKLPPETPVKEGEETGPVPPEERPPPPPWTPP